jgi:hypothetical protein
MRFCRPVERFCRGVWIAVGVAAAKPPEDDADRIVSAGDYFCTRNETGGKILR